MIDFQFEMKRCPICTEEKIRAIHFSMKGVYCRDCARKRVQKQDHRKIRDPKMKWRAFKIDVNGLLQRILCMGSFLMGESILSQFNSQILDFTKM